MKDDPERHYEYVITDDAGRTYIVREVGSKAESQYDQTAFEHLFTPQMPIIPLGFNSEGTYLSFFEHDWVTAHYVRSAFGLEAPLKVEPEMSKEWPKKS